MNLSETENNRLQKIMLVRSYVSAGNSVRKTARDLKVGRATVAKYLNGNPEELCRWHGDCNRKCEYGIEPFLGFITECVNDGKSPSETHRELQRKFGYGGSFHAFYNHLRRNAEQYGWVIRSKCRSNRAEVKHPKMVSRSALFHHLWNRQELPPEWKAHIFGRYSVLHILDRCVREFRDMFQHQCVCRLHCFIERYSVCGIAPLESFAKGLLNDIDAVEYAVSNDWSNGFVEGTNNRLKTVKRMMYGRCGRQLLEAKMLL